MNNNRIKYYIHLVLYFIVIILLSVSLSGYWIELKVGFKNQSFLKISLFKLYLNINLPLADLIEENGQLNISLDKEDREIIYLNPLIIELDLDKIKFSEIRNKCVDYVINLNLESKMLHLVNKYNLIPNNVNFGEIRLQSEYYRYLTFIILEEINKIFNKERPTDNDTFHINQILESGDKKVNMTTEKNYVQSGKLKTEYKKIQDQILDIVELIQMLIITAIVLLFIHFLMILFKGRRIGYFNYQGIFTVFLPMILLLILTILYFTIIHSHKEFITLIYYRLYVASTIIVFITWLLGLFKII